MQSTSDKRLRQMMAALLRHYGRQNWWPARSRFEVIAGALLVQNTAWTNAEKALRNLRREGILSPAGIRSTSLPRLEQVVRPSGFFRQKARRLKTFVGFLDVRYGGSLSRMFATETVKLRKELLELNGIGEETADAILLYAGGHETFVVDAYARRVAERHGMRLGRYAETQGGFAQISQGLEEIPMHERDPRHAVSEMSRRRESWSPKARVFMEAHAVLVRVGNDHCRRSPDCEKCPLRKFLPVSLNAETRHRGANFV